MKRHPEGKMKKPLIRVGIGVGIVIAVIALVVCFVS